MPPTHTADFQTAALKATDLDAVEKVNVGLETELVKKHVNIIADAPEIRIQDKTGSSPGEVNETTMSIVADGGTTHFRAGIDTFAEGSETKGDIKFQSSTGATTHAKIVGSSGKLELQDGGLGLKRGSNVSVTGTSGVIQEITGPHARESAVLKKYPEVPLSSNVQSGYVASASSEYSINYQIWKAHDGDTVSGGAPSYYYSAATQAYSTTDGSYTGATYSTTSSGTAYAGEYVQMQFPTPIKLSRVRIVCPDAGATYNKNSPKQGVICGSNDGTTWTTIATYSGITYATLGASAIIQAPSNVAYKYIRLVATHIEGVGSTGWFVIEELEYYGYEDVAAGDDSVDTTVKSVYNAPDLTSAALYIDGLKGSAATDHSGSSVAVTENNATYDSSEKAWVLSGAATSNIVTADLGLEGDQPHSVSAWVKADVLNGDGLFHVGTAEGEGDAASRVGFVNDSHISYGGEDHFFSNAAWHNVTYTYNGEGSDKKLYIDGRHVGTAKNEDTFGQYPPFPMVAHSVHGYTISASSEYNTSDYPAWEAFNKSHSSNGDAWLSGNAQNYNGGDGAYSGSANLGSDSGGVAFANADKGEWLKIEMPHKMVLDYIDICGSTSNSVNPKDWKIWGSNDGKNWDVLLSKTNSVTAAYNGTAGRIHIVSATRAYKFFALVVTRTNGYTWYVQVSELRFYGHRENDLVRFPDPTNVLTYPHINFTAHENTGTTGYHEFARRGYVVSASTKYAAVSAADAWRAFDGVVDLTSGSGGQSWDSGQNTYSGAGTGRASTGTTTFNSRNGEWINVKFPRKVLLTSYQHWTRMDRDHEGPYSGYLYGSNDGFSTFQEIHRFAAITLPTTSGGVKYLHTVSSSYTPSGGSAVTLIPYNEYRLQVTHTQGSPYLNIALLEFYGTESEAVIARVGDGFDGKIRNLRVFSTALSQDRVQEIFDADKDEFGLAKSSVSIYQGRLGVGTTEPKAALTVMDEVAELEEFPPRAGGFDGDEWYIDGHGTFRATASNYHADAYFAPGRAFTKSLVYNFGYASVAGSSLRWKNNGGLPNLSPASGFEPAGIFEGHRGDWLELELPYQIYVKKFQIQTRIGTWGPGDHPKNGALYGSNDRNTWTVLTEFTNLSYTPPELNGIGGQTANWAVNSTSSYKYLRLMTTQKIDGVDDWLMISELRYFGTREQGASTLSNGELSLTRNLTVPRIGPPLDTDDTPRSDRLVVEYNTTTNPMENGVVKDTSGRGFDGRMTGATYDASEKAFIFDGTNDYISADLPSELVGDPVFTMSIWVNPITESTASGNYDTFVHIGHNNTSGQVQLTHYGYNGTHLQLGGYGQGMTTDDVNVLTPGRWTHLCAVIHSGAWSTTTKKLYVDGKLYNTTLSGSGTTSIPVGSSSSRLVLGAVISQGGTSFNHFSHSKLSNFKLWGGVALTSDEVKRIYEMGRCDEGHHVVNFSKTRVGIGLGDGETPRAALDVRGDIYGGCPVYFAATATSTTNADNVIIWDDVKEERGGGYDAGTGTFTAPIAGVYKFYYTIRQSGSAGTAAYARIQKNGSDISSGYGAVYLSTTRDQGSAEALIKLNVDDTIRIYLRNFSIAAHYNSFVGEYFSSL